MSRQKSHSLKIATAVTLCITALGWNALGQTSDPALNALVKKGILTEAEAKQALAETEAQKKTTPTPPATTTTAAPETTRNPFVWTAGPEFKMKLGGFIQGNAEFGDVGSFLGNFSDNPSGAANHTPLHDPRFFIRRARLNLTGDFLERFDFKLEGDFQQSDGISSDRTGFSGTDIFINYNQLPEANIKFGQYKAPFGLEQLTPDTTMFLAERSLPTGALTPERQIGVQLWGKPLSRVDTDYTNLIDYAVGAFNGNGRNIGINDDAHLMYVARIGLTPFTGTLFDQPVKWRLGANGLNTRYGKGTRISPSGSLALNTDGSLSSYTAPDSAEAWGWGVDQSLTIGPFDLVAEYLEQKITPSHNTTFHGFVANGYYVQPSYFFLGRKLQAVARWESFNPGRVDNDNIESAVGGLNWYIKGDYIKLMFDYYHTWSDYRKNHSGTGKDQFDVGLVRLQLMF